METIAFEDIHAVAVRIAARKLTLQQRSDAERAAQSLVRTVHARQSQAKVQIQRVGFINEAAKLTGDDSFGFHLAIETDTRELGITHYVFSASATALDAIRNLIRYHHLVNTTTSLVIEETGQHVTINSTFRSGLQGLEQHVAEWGTATFVAALRRLTSTRISPLSMTFVHRRNAYSSEFSAFFGCPVQFGANRQSIIFATKDLLVPIHSADQYLLNILKAFCEEALRRRKMPPTPTRAKVEAALLELLPNGKATLSNVASTLATSARSLGRRLSEEGTSYTAVLSELRHELAIHYLENKNLEVSQIAWLLGYMEVSSFNHAFKRWTTSSPKAVRTSLAART